MIYERTCPRGPECSAVFEQKRHDLRAPPFLFTQSHYEWLFVVVVSQMKKSSKGNTFSRCGRSETKTAEALKDIKISEFKNCLEQWKKRLDRCIASKGEYSEGD